MSAYVVAEATQVNHAGRVYGPGEVVDLDEEEAAPLLTAGTVSPKAGKAKGTRKR